jgi:ubiquinone biosynthesis protein
LVDFGIIGHFTKKLKDKSIELFYGIVEEDLDSIIDSFLDMGLISEKQTKIEDFKADIIEVIDPLQGSSLDKVKVSYVLEDVLDIALKHHVKLPLDFVLFGKTILEIEGVGLEYAPKFKFVDSAKPFLEKLIKKDVIISNMSKDLVRSLIKYRRFFKDLPDQINNTFRRIQKGTIKIDVEDTDVKRLGKDIDTSSNRLTYGMIIAALIIAGALLAPIGKPILYGYSIASVLSFIFALFFILLLFFSIKNEGK